MLLQIIILSIYIISINCQETLKIGTINILSNKTEYSCVLYLHEINNLKENINYIIFDFIKEDKTKRNKIYISYKENEANNIDTYFKLPSFDSNKIIIPYEYATLENKLYIKIFCYYNQKCNEEIYINIYDKISIEEGETLYLNGYKENYNYDFIYKYDNNINDNIYKQISSFSYQKNDFEMNINNNNGNIKLENIMNGYLFIINSKEYKNSNFDVRIKIKKSSAYIILQLISIDNNIKYNNIDLIKPIIGLLTKEESQKCFCIDKNYKTSDEYFIDFILETESQSLIFESENINNKNILYSQTVNYSSQEGKFCINKLYPFINSIFFYFIVYTEERLDIFPSSDPQLYFINKSYLGLLYNGFFYKKRILENIKYNSYFPAEYNSDILYFYIYAVEGIIEVTNIKTNNFPFEQDEDKIKINDNNIENIGNEYFGKIMIKNDKNKLTNISSSPMNAYKDLILIKCASGISFSNDYDSHCIYNIICYSEKDILKLKINEKFSLLNYDKINLNIEIEQNFEINKNKLIIDTYTHFGSSYLEVINKDENSDLNTFYNGQLISNEIIYNYNTNKDNNLINYNLKLFSYDYDYVSLIITGNIDSDDDILNTRFWINDFILTTLTKRITKKHFKIDHIPKALTDISFHKTYFLFKYTNCEVNTKLISNEKYQNNFENIVEEKIDNVQLISFEGMLSESKNIIEFEIDLKNIHNNEPVCMIYFTSFLLIDMNYGLFFLYPILIKENTDTPILFSNSNDYSIQLEYIIFNYDSPIIISISFDEMTEIDFSYSIEGSKLNNFIIYYTHNIIIYQNEIKEKCKKDKTGENKLCKLKMEISKHQDSKYKSNFFSDKTLLNIKIKSNYEKQVSYLNLNTLTDGIILGEQFQYYYTNIRQYDSGTISMTNKKGLGIMYARIINKNTEDIKDKDWNGRIHLLTKEELEECSDCLIYDINNNEINISEEDTKDCLSELRCQIIIGVGNIESKREDNANEYNVYEYSIYFLKNNAKNNIFGNLKIQANKYIKGSLSNNNKFIIEYYLPDKVENIKYEIQCKYCSFYLNDENGNDKIRQNIVNENIIKLYGSNIITFPNNKNITNFYNKLLYLEFTSDKSDLLFYKISLIFKGMNESLSILNSEMNSLCYQECYYLIPLYDYDKLTSLTMSITDENLNGNINAELDFYIYDSIEYYSYILFKNFTYKTVEGFSNIKPKIENIHSIKNYIVFENNNKYKNMIIICHVKIEDNFNINKLNTFYVYFTYSKNSRKNYFLYPNINNLLYINKNSELENIKEIRIPDYYLLKKDTQKNIQAQSIIQFSHLKGEGVIELVTNNIYIHNNANKLYTELKSFKFDQSHSFFQINYEKKSNFSKKLFINSDMGLYTYSSIKANLQKNLNEIKIGKANYILNRYDEIKDKLLYIKIESKEEIMNDITVDIKVEGLDIYKNYDIKINGYYTYNILDKNNEYNKGFYDNITNIAIIKFDSKEMLHLFKENKNNYLVINISMTSMDIHALDIMFKIYPIPIFLNSLNNEVFHEYSIPQFEHFFSYIDFSFNNYIIYKLNLINKEQNYISLELHFMNKETDFSLHSDKSHLINYLYQNETIIDLLNIVDERYQNGKRSIILKLGNNIKEIFLVIFNKKENIKKEFFSIKYYGLTSEDYQEGKYLYKKRFSIENTKLQYNENKNMVKWEKIYLNNLKENKGEINIDYYLKIENIGNEYIYNNNDGLFDNFIINSKMVFGVHLINRNEYKIKNIDEDNIVIFLIAKFNELNGMENLLLYEPLLLNKEFKEKNNNNEHNNKVSNNMIFKIFILFLIIIVIILIALCMYKFIRKMQIKTAYDKYIKKIEPNQNTFKLFNENKLPFESKISFLIEN